MVFAIFYAQWIIKIKISNYLIKTYESIFLVEEITKWVKE